MVQTKAVVESLEAFRLLDKLSTCDCLTSTHFDDTLVTLLQVKDLFALVIDAHFLRLEVSVVRVFCLIALLFPRASLLLRTISIDEGGAGRVDQLLRSRHIHRHRLVRRWVRQQFRITTFVHLFVYRFVAFTSPSHFHGLILHAVGESISHAQWTLT